jgi:cytochrome c-type biogenesis protein CcmE
LTRRRLLPWRSGRRLPLVLLGLVAVAVIALVAVAGMQGTLSYYRTPTEIAGSPPPEHESVRVGGLVTVGTVHYHGSVVRFVLTDGASDLDVVSRGVPPSTFRGGQGAVVVGHVLRGGLFRADQVEVRHSNEYEPATSARQ